MAVTFSPAWAFLDGKKRDFENIKEARNCWISDGFEGKNPADLFPWLAICRWIDKGAGLFLTCCTVYSTVCGFMIIFLNVCAENYEYLYSETKTALED